MGVGVGGKAEEGNGGFEEIPSLAEEGVLGQGVDWEARGRCFEDLLRHTSEDKGVFYAK